MKRITLIFVLLMSLTIASCGSETLSDPTTAPTPTPMSLPTSTPTAIPTAVPPTPTPEADPKAPFTVGEANLQLSKVTLGGDVGGMQLAPEGMTADQIALVIQVKIISGTDAETVAAMEVWIADESGTKYTNKIGLSGGSATDNEPVWVIAVPQNASILFLHFPSGETVNLTSWLK